MVDSFKESDFFLTLTKQQLKQLLTLIKNVNYDFNFLFETNRQFGYVDKELNQTEEVFGIYATNEDYQLIQEIAKGNIDTPQMKKIGITKPGPQGIEQLKNFVSNFRKDIVDPNFDESILLEDNNEYVLNIFKALVRFSKSEWGRHDNGTLKEMIESYHQARLNGDIRELPSEYEPSGTLNIARVDLEKQQEFEFSQEAKKVYQSFQQSLRTSLDLLKQKNVFSQLASQLQEKINNKIQELKKQLKELLNSPKPQSSEKAYIFKVKNIEKQIELLESINPRSLKDFQDNFDKLTNKIFKGEFKEDLRQLLFVLAFKDSHDNQELVQQAQNVSQSEISFDNVSWMLNFIDHTVAEELWKRYFQDKDKKVKKQGFRKTGIVNTTTLQDEFKRAQNQDTKGYSMMDFIPTRNVLIEFSGHIADACWANVYQSIAEEFPNFIAVMMLQNKGIKSERLAGANFLVETEAQDGTPLLVIRGLNPLQNIINQLSYQDFTEKYFSYLKQIAHLMGRKLAIVVDNHQGGSGTNRQGFYDYLNQNIRQKKRRIVLASDEDTYFNGYNIVRETYLLED